METLVKLYFNFSICHELILVTVCQLSFSSKIWDTSVIIEMCIQIQLTYIILTKLDESLYLCMFYLVVLCIIMSNKTCYETNSYSKRTY